MIGIIFDFGGELVEVRIDGVNCYFRTKQFGGQFTTIEGLRLEKKGVEKEHPDLKGDKRWREKAIERFKKKLKDYKTERERINYIQEDLKKFGYIPLFEQKAGHRPKKLS